MSLVISIMGLILTIISLMQKRLQFDIFSYNLIDSKKISLSKLKIYYSEKNVEKLTVSKIVFWNCAFRHIESADIAKSAPIAISLNEGKILDLSVLRGNKIPNIVSISRIEEKKAIISFDYLNKREGGIIQIIHTGDENNINISGAIKGGHITTVQGKHSIILNILRMGMFSVSLALFFIVLIIIVPPNMINECRMAYLETVPEKYGAINVRNLMFLLITLIFFSIIGFFQEKSNFIPKNCRDNKKK